MKTSIKTTIAIIAVAVGSISMAQAGQNHHDRDYDRSYDRSYEKPRHQRQFRKNERRQHWKRDQYRQKHYRAKRHFRKHYRYEHNGNRHLRVYKRLHRQHSGWRGGHNRIEKHVYRQNTFFSPRHTSRQVIVERRHHSNNALPVVAGTLIGSVIANDASNGDPVATFGGAVFGAMVGNAISHH